MTKKSQVLKHAKQHIEANSGISNVNTAPKEDPRWDYNSENEMCRLKALKAALLEGLKKEEDHTGKLV